MRRIVHKLIFVWDFDKEERWLNEMAAKGLCLVGVGFCRYEFEECEPGEYNICMQLLEKSVKDPESQKYIEFLEATGAEHIGTFTRWVYFRKKAELGSFELFSDNASRVKYLKRIVSFIGVISAMNLLIGVQNILMAFTLDSYANLIGILNLALGIWGTWGTVRLAKKKKRLNREGQLFE